MDEDLRQILKYRSWQISNAYDRIENADKYKLDKDTMDLYYEAIMDFMFFAHKDLIKFEKELK